MENKAFQFKTNINCSGCVTAVKPHLDKVEAIQEWNVDTSSPDKILTIQTADLDETQIVDIIKKTGFSAEAI